MTVLDRDTAERIERCVTSGHVALVELLAKQDRNRLGASVRRFADDVVATRVIGEPDLQWLQHVTGLNPRTITLLPDILSWYADSGLSPRFEMAPDRPFAPLAASLGEAGFAQTDFIDLLWAPAASLRVELEALGHVEVVHVEPGSPDADEFARVLLGGHEVEDASAEHHTALAAMAGLAGRSCYLASIDTQPVGAAILTIVDGVGYLANASTLPDARERGAQQALIAHRVADAQAASCDVIAGLANPFFSSHRNMERVGLRVAYTKVSWTRSPAS